MNGPAKILVSFLTSAIVIMAIGGCTTTQSSPPTRTPGPAQQQTRQPAAEIPIDSSAIAAVVNSRVVLATRAIGEVPFDGQVLPILSPSGRYLATQTGEAPDWATITGAPGQAVSARTQVAAYDLSSSPPRLIRWREQLPTGSLLGRSADEAGFLIEQVRPNASRRIGKVSWASGEVTWLTNDGEIAAGATLVQSQSAASFVTAAREQNDPRQSLVLRGRGGSDLRNEPQISYSMPTATSDPDVLMAIAQTSTGTELLAMRIAAGASATQPRSVVMARRPISDSADPLVAYQAMSPLQSPLPLAPDAAGEQPPGLLFFHPGASRMAIFDVSTGALTMLAENSIAGAWHLRRTESGAPVWSVFLTTPGGLRHQTLLRSARLFDVSPAARVSDEVWVPRSTTDSARPYILIGPSKRDPRALVLVEMRPMDPPR